MKVPPDVFPFGMSGPDQFVGVGDNGFFGVSASRSEKSYGLPAGTHAHHEEEGHHDDHDDDHGDDHDDDHDCWHC